MSRGKNADHNVTGTYAESSGDQADLTCKVFQGKHQCNPALVKMAMSINSVYTSQTILKKKVQLCYNVTEAMEELSKQIYTTGGRM